MKNEILIPSVDFETGKVFVFNSCKFDFEGRKEKFISNVSLGKAVRASCSYPIVFSPCQYNDTVLLDGGIKENIPWEELKLVGCDKILSIGFENENKKKSYNNIIDIAERSFELILEELNRHELEKIDFLHTIKLKNISLLEIEKMQEIYEEGYKQTKEKIREIKKYLAK